MSGHAFWNPQLARAEDRQMVHDLPMLSDNVRFSPTADQASNLFCDIRDEIRRRCRLACLLGSGGAVELPMSLMVAGPDGTDGLSGASSSASEEESTNDEFKAKNSKED